MAVFSRSVFQSVLDRLDAERDDELPDDEPSAPMPRGLKTSFVYGTPDSGVTDAASVAHGFAAFDAEPAGPPDPPAWVERVSEAEIAEDLSIGEGDGPEALQALRRAFAKDNHPDRVHPDFAKAATIRMTVANRLIDDRLAALAGRSQPRPG